MNECISEPRSPKDKYAIILIGTELVVIHTSNCFALFETVAVLWFPDKLKSEKHNELMIYAIGMYSRNFWINISHKTMVFTSTSLTDIIEEFNVTFIDIFVEVSNKIGLLAIPVTEVIKCGMDLRSTETECQYDEND